MNPLIAIFGGGPGELIVVLIILLLLFGSAKLPKLARSLGASVTEFRKGIRGEGDDDDKKNLPEGKTDEPAPASSDKAKEEAPKEG